MAILNICNMKKIVVFTITLIVTVTACRVQKDATVTPARRPLVEDGSLWGAMWQQKASEYKALCYQAYNIAALRIGCIVQEQHTKPVAIVTDIDETVLDNSPYAIHRALKDSGYSDESWMTWTFKAACDTVPGALSFLKYAFDRGVRIFYITNRLEAERKPTLVNLQHWNFPDATDDHLFLKQTSSGKEQRRSIVAKEYDIVLLCGDNLSDFSAVFDRQPFAERDQRTMDNAALFGQKFIVLPNASYGDWEGALYDFKYTLPATQKDSTILRQLKTY
jgi:5'-nucleotidase (lipoprotein e(P4) family)